jgi:hypothetical protein
MKWRVLIPLCAWTLLLYSCKEVSFKEPQPSGVAALREVPADVRGRFVPETGDDRDKRDTLIIESWGYRFTDSNDKDWLGRGVISDSLVIKFYQDYYFINFRSGDQWVLRLLKKHSDQSLEFLSIDLQEENRKETLKRLSKKVKVTELHRGDDTFYQINPTPGQLMMLIKEGYFTGMKLSRKK